MGKLANKKMIILRMLGGLGNQLFIYAFGRSLQLLYDQKVFFDIHSGFIRDPYKRIFKLDKFNTAIKPVSIFDSMFYPLNKHFRALASLVYPESIYINEDDNFSIDNLNSLRGLSKKIFLEGYFQKESYFAKIRTQLLKEITLRESPSNRINYYLEQVQQNNSVAVHIRGKERINVKSIQFYKDSISQLNDKLNIPKYFIFTDDMVWVKSWLQIQDNIIFVSDTLDDIEDFWIMRQCNHFVISDSTFAFWAAWCCTKEANVVITQQNINN